MTIKKIILVSMACLSLSACGTADTMGDRAVLGGALGLGIGAIGGNVGGALAGAAVGAAVGALSATID